MRICRFHFRKVTGSIGRALHEPNTPQRAIVEVKFYFMQHRVFLLQVPIAHHLWDSRVDEW